MEPSKEELYAMGRELAIKLWNKKHPEVKIPPEADSYGRAYQDIEKYTKRERTLYKIPLSFTAEGIIWIVNLEDVDIERGCKIGLSYNSKTRRK